MKKHPLRVVVDESATAPFQEKLPTMKKVAEHVADCVLRRVHPRATLLKMMEDNHIIGQLSQSGMLVQIHNMLKSGHMIVHMEKERRTKLATIGSGKHSLSHGVQSAIRDLVPVTMHGELI